MVNRSFSYSKKEFKASDILIQVEERSKKHKSDR